MTSTPLNIYQEKIYQNCAYTKFQKGRVRHPYPVKEKSRTDKSKYDRFYKIHDHTTDDCIQLKDVIEGLNKKRQLTEYIKWVKKIGRNHLYIATIKDQWREQRDKKEKHLYTATINEGDPREKLPSKSTMKKKSPR